MQGWSRTRRGDRDACWCDASIQGLLDSRRARHEGRGAAPRRGLLLCVVLSCLTEPAYGGAPKRTVGVSGRSEQGQQLVIRWDRARRRARLRFVALLDCRVMSAKGAFRRGGDF